MRLQRQFGRVVGGILLAIGLFSLWRDRWPAAVGVTLAAIGFLLVVFALVYPAALARPFRYWMALAEALSFVSTRVILAIVFFLVAWPLGVILRRFHWDPLATTHRGNTHWRDYPAGQRNSQHFEQMF